MGKLVIFSAPSGSGKTTIVRRLLSHFPQFEFSISATSRQPRGTEQHGVDYYFLTAEEFAKAVAEERFVEREEVYAGTCHGTLHSEMERRLRGRATDSEEVIAKRVAKAEFELSKASEFDHVVVNDDLDTAVNETIAIINDFLN